MSDSANLLEVGRTRLQSIIGSPDAIWENIASGSLVGLIAIFINIGYAALIFSGPLVEFLPFGIGITLVTLMVATLVIAVGSSLPIMNGGPDTITVTIMAIGAGNIALQLRAVGAVDQIFPGMEHRMQVPDIKLYRKWADRAGELILKSIDE